MKYIKRLNIDFNDWDYIDNDYQEKLDKFIKNNKFVYLRNNKFIGINRLKVNEKGWYIFCNYVKLNKLNVKWMTYDKILKNDYNYQIKSKYVYVYLTRDRRIFIRPIQMKKNNLNEYDFNTLDITI